MNLELNRRLALLLGWSNIVDVGGALLGQPPAGEPECRGQAKVPNWTGDWVACGPLLSDYMLMIESSEGEATCWSYDIFNIVEHADCESEDEAVRRSIVMTVIAELES